MGKMKDLHAARETVEIVDAIPSAERIARTDLAVGDTVFDAWGRHYAVVKVRQYRRTTTATRDDGWWFSLFDDDTITVIKGGAR